MNTRTQSPKLSPLSPTAQPQPTAHCYHCGDACSVHPIAFDDKNFCCEGCKQVYSLLNSNGMCEYYALQDMPGMSRRNAEAALQYAWLDTEDVRNKMLDFSDDEQAKVTFYTPQMHCYSCIWLLENLYKLLPGIIGSRVNFLKKEVYITFQPQTKLSDIAAMMARIGYAPEIHLDALTHERTKYNNRKFLYQLGVAGFCFGNIMLLSFPEYFSIHTYIEKAHLNFFSWLNLLLALPVFFYSAWDYHVSALQSLRRGEINIDVPLSLGLTALFVRSMVEIGVLNHAGYLDSLSGLVFFLLIGKWFRNATYDRLSFDRDYSSYFPVAVTRIEGAEERTVAVTQLHEGDHIIIKNGEIIPADAVLLSNQTEIDYSFVTGESDAVRKHVGDLLYAGGRQVGAAIELRLVKKVNQSYLTQLWENQATDKQLIQKAGIAFDSKGYLGFTQSGLQKIADAWGKYFTLVTLGIAFSAAMYWGFTESWMKALDVTTAILMVACPCALALSIPVLLGQVVKIFGKNKLYVKNISVVEEMASANTIVFDKTGTITHKAAGSPVFYPVCKSKICSSENCEKHSLPEAQRSLLKSVVRHSAHPLSRAVYRWCGAAEIQAVEGFSEIIGMGITGEVGGKKLKIGSESYVLGNVNSLSIDENAVEERGSRVYMAIDDVVRGFFVIPDAYRTDWDGLLASLKGYQTALLSGDRDSERAFLTRHFAVGSDLRFEQSPQDKLDYIYALQTTQKRRVLMLGDGLNDAGALRQAHVGVALSEDVNNFSPACDAILDASAFNKMNDFLQFAQRSIRMMKWGFALSLVYNFVGLGFAVAGLLSPLVAAILMPISSISVVLWATISTRISANKLGL